MKTNKNDSVYPSIDETYTRISGNNGDTVTDFIGSNGLTKREHFAVIALNGILARNPKHESTRESIVEKAVDYADLLLEALNKEAK